MHEPNFYYIDELKSKFKNDGLQIYDFLDPTATVATSSCEFVDGRHGGEILYAKILAYMSAREPMLQPYINMDYLTTISSEYSGLSMIPNKSITTKAEIDFLGIGCAKSRQQLW